MSKILPTKRGQHRGAGPELESSSTHLNFSSDTDGVLRQFYLKNETLNRGATLPLVDWLIFNLASSPWPTLGVTLRQWPLPGRTKVYVQGSIGTYQGGSNGLKRRVEIRIASGAGGGYTP